MGKVGLALLKRVICAHEKYYMFDERYGLSSCNRQIHNSLQASRLVEDLIFFPYDQLIQLSLQGMCDALYQKGSNAEAVVYYVPWHDYWIPLVETLNRLRARGVKVIAFYSDLITAQADAIRYHLYQEHSRCADCLLSIDSNGQRPFNDHPLHIQGFAGLDPGVFARHPAAKDIDVSFLGSRSQSYHSRREYIGFLTHHLTSRGIRFLVGGGQLPEERPETLLFDDYVDILSRSKITLNFSRTLGDQRQLKGRVLEALACRTFLLEEENPHTRRLFEEGLDYRAFDSPDELLNLILYYLEHEQEREAIANSGWQKVNRFWNARNLWGYVFEKLGFDISEAKDESFMQFRWLMDKIQGAV